jgi:hypothetical protein
MISAVGEHDDTLARELGARPKRYGPGLAAGVRALGPVDAVFDAADTGVLADAVHLAGGARRVITLSDPTCMNWVGGRYWDRTSDLLGVNEAPQATRPQVQQVYAGQRHRHNGDDRI